MKLRAAWRERGWEQTGSSRASGHGKGEDLERSHRAGFDNHLVKHVDPRTLISSLLSLVRRAKPFLPRRTSLRTDRPPPGTMRILADRADAIGDCGSDPARQIE
jgi:hypothetical protein